MQMQMQMQMQMMNEPSLLIIYTLYVCVCIYIYTHAVNQKYEAIEQRETRRDTINLIVTTKSIRPTVRKLLC